MNSVSTDTEAVPVAMMICTIIRKKTAVPVAEHLACVSVVNVVDDVLITAFCTETAPHTPSVRSFSLNGQYNLATGTP